MQQIFTVSIFTENYPGLLHRVTTVFTKRKQNIESITASESEINGIHRYTIVIKATREMAQVIVNQLEKQVDILKAFIHEESEVVFQDLALFKIPTTTLFREKEVEEIVRLHHARILTVEEEFVVFEITGHKAGIHELYNRLKPFGILEFVSSGRVAITKPMRELSSYLEEQKEMNH
ncbi:MAG: acetolactate synthase small subunit [Bacteroidetes bacterium]|nr:acetolactate synthase small subunit [Bacteroidota bacterium]MBU1717816.1 acetolactate synthase small subunit [Bacteroidota bacterium]